MALYKDWIVPLAELIVRHDIQGPAFALGDQQTYFTERWVRRVLHHRKLLRREVTAFPDHVDPTFVSVASVLEMLGVDPYSDIDLSERARIRADLSAPLPQELHGTAGLVLDVGTTEHILDIAAVFRNTVRLTRIGGTIIHMSPVNWLYHGFVNFNPLLFEEFYEHNGFEVLESKFIITPFEQAIREAMRLCGLRHWYLGANWALPSFCVKSKRYGLQLIHDYLWQFPRIILIFAARKVKDVEPRLPIQRLYHADIKNGR
jgi:hypothetical protein